MADRAHGRACHDGGQGFSISMSLRLAIALAPACVVAVTAILGGCAQYQSLPADPAGRLFARGLDDIAEYYIRPASSRLLVLGGARGLAQLDHGLVIAENPGPDAKTEIVVDYRNSEAAIHPEPADADPHAWGALLGRLVADAKAASPGIAALSNERIETAVFNGITGVLDPWSRYASPAAARDQRALRDGFGGIGVTLEYAAGAFEVASVTPHGPADFAGIRPGDRIVAIDGEPTAGRQEASVAYQLRGPVASTVELSIWRSGREESFRLRRALIVPPTVSLVRHGDIAVFHVSRFNQSTTKELVQYLEELLHGEPPRLRGIVLDLRGDPGGLLDQAVSLADIFIPGGPIAATAGRNPASRQLFDAAGDSIAPRIPLVVLINGASASASEVVAAALQDTGRAVIVGSSSYGKGTVQTIIRLFNGGELSLTWALLIAPSGYLLNGHGVVPTLCTSDLGDDTQSLGVALARAGSAAISPLEARRRATLSEADWLQLRRSCPARLGVRPVDMRVAEDLLADPALFQQAVHVIARAPKLAGGMVPGRRGLTESAGSLLSGEHNP